MDRRSIPLLAGVPELLILRLLADREMYGYELARSVRVLTRDALSLGEGVLYPALHALEARRLLRSRTVRVDGRVRVYYSISARGKARLIRLTDQWQRVTATVGSVLGGGGHV